MDIDSNESDASLDYDEPRRKGKGKAPKKKDKRKSKITEVSTVPECSQIPFGIDTHEKSFRLPTRGRHLTLGLGTQSKKMSLEVCKLQ